jgi:hypothetical protein
MRSYLLLLIKDHLMEKLWNMPIPLLVELCMTLIMRYLFTILVGNFALQDYMMKFKIIE